ncbi:MAG: cation:dicarboxylate symporter family transporter, partial [Brevinema sp.]
MLKNNLIVRLILGILGGIAVGMSNIEVLIRLLATFNSLFGSFLSFIIPLLILAFITYGIAQLGNNSKKTLGITVAISYTSTVLVGLFVLFIDLSVFPTLLSGSVLGDLSQGSKSVDPYLSLSMPPLMSVMTALILSFILGIGISLSPHSSLKGGFAEFHEIILKTVSSVVIPLLPIHIAGVFATLTYTGQVGMILTSFAKVFAVVIVLHLSILLIQYTIAGIIAKKNGFKLLKNMIPAYLTAVGTQSSAATIPVTVQSIKNNGVKPQIAEFVGSLCANIHMSGSITTLTSCSLAVLILFGMPIEIMDMVGFIFLLGIM